jgi:hypothetical protein
MNDGRPGQEERDASARDRMEAMNDRLASAKERAGAEADGPKPDLEPGVVHERSNGIPPSRHFSRTRRPD